MHNICKYVHTWEHAYPKHCKNNTFEVFAMRYNNYINRSHDVKVGKQFYHKLKALRDALGLQFRFEVIFDDGSHLLNVSEHFMKRLTKWGATPTATKPRTTTAAGSGTGSPTEQSQEREGEREGDRSERGAPRKSRIRSDGSAKSCKSSGSGAGSCLGQAFGGDGGTGLHSYKQLEHLPCVVVLAGSSRAGLSFPR